MTRDPRKLRVFNAADSLVLDIYHVTQGFPPEERYGLQAQLRRAAVSVAANIVEGCARDPEAEYVNFLNIATGSCAETRYLLDIAHRLGMLPTKTFARIYESYTDLFKGLQALVNSLRPRPRRMRG